MKSLLTGCAMLLAAAGWQTADAASVTYADSISLSTTDWTSSVAAPLFDPSLGTLTSVSLALTGALNGTIFVENMDHSPSTVSETLSATLTLKRPDLSTLVAAFPSYTATDSFTAYDGVLDFGGTSGVTHGPIMASASDTFVTPPPGSDLPLFTGVGNIVLPVTAHGTSHVAGSGNLAAGFQTAAGAFVEVTYTYDVLPEPGTLTLLSVGLMAAGWRRRKA
jgi:hypothetical protein